MHVLPRATVAGRVGFIVVPSLLVYGKAGYGWVGEHNTMSTSGVLTNDANNARTFGALDAGGGFEWKMHANWSLWVDITILVKTIPAVLSRRGAY